MDLIETQFIQHVADHGLSYGTLEEFNFRKDLFAKVDAEIQEINNSQYSFELGHNFMSTMTDGEKRRLNGYRSMGLKNYDTVLEESFNASSVNWVEAGMVNPFKNQASCGSCWAFSATAAMESEHAIKTGDLISLSEEELVQCDHLGSNGCNGGSMEGAFMWLESHYQNTEAKYPYTSGRGKTGSCDEAKVTGEVKATGYHNVTPESVSQLKAAVNKGVVSIAIEADKSVFQQYRRGVLDSAACGTNLDHGVALVGYGEEAGQEYWLVRNSWGASWGDEGYVKIAIEEGKGICGIQMGPVYPETN